MRAAGQPPPTLNQQLVRDVFVETTTQIELIRHGEPVGGRRYRGDQVDDPLSETGWQQMRRRIALCRAAGEDDWAAVVSSPMRRCRDFAEALAVERGLKLHVDPDLREIGFGIWEGLAHTEIPERYPEQFAAFRADPVNGRPEGAENMDDFFARVSGGLQRWIAEYPGRKLLVVGHAVVMRAATAWAMGAPQDAIARVDTEYASLLRLACRNGQPRVTALINEL